MGTPAVNWDIQYKGEAYRLTLRTAEDGYIAGFERAAFDAAVGAATKQDILADEFATNKVMALIVGDVEQNGKSTDIPWNSWFEIPRETLEQVLDAFFFSFARKTLRSIDSSTSTPKTEETLRSLKFLCVASTYLSETSLALPTESETSGGDSKSSAG